LIETTAGEALSAAATSAVRRDASIVLCTSATRAGVWAPASDVINADGRSELSQPVMAATVSAERLRQMDRGTLLSYAVREELGRVGDCCEIESLRGCRRAGGLVVSPAEEHAHVGDGAAAEADVNHGSDQHSNHALEESVGFDVKAHPSASGADLPLGQHKVATMVRLVGLGRERAEVVLSPDDASRGPKQVVVEGPSKRPLERTAEWRSRCLIEADVVSVAPR
jgi:hypothetical protein